MPGPCAVGGRHSGRLGGVTVLSVHEGGGGGGGDRSIRAKGHFALSAGAVAAEAWRTHRSPPPAAPARAHNTLSALTELRIMRTDAFLGGARTERKLTPLPFFPDRPRVASEHAARALFLTVKKSRQIRAAGRQEGQKAEHTAGPHSLPRAARSESHSLSFPNVFHLLPFSEIAAFAARSPEDCQQNTRGEVKARAIYFLFMSPRVETDRPLSVTLEVLRTRITQRQNVTLSRALSAERFASARARPLLLHAYAFLPIFLSMPQGAERERKRESRRIGQFVFGVGS